MCTCMAYMAVSAVFLPVACFPKNSGPFVGGPITSIIMNFGVFSALGPPFSETCHEHYALPQVAERFANIIYIYARTYYIYI